MRSERPISPPVIMTMSPRRYTLSRCEVDRSGIGRVRSRGQRRGARVRRVTAAVLHPVRDATPHRRVHGSRMHGPRRGERRRRWQPGARCDAPRPCWYRRVCPAGRGFVRHPPKHAASHIPRWCQQTRYEQIGTTPANPPMTRPGAVIRRKADCPRPVVRQSVPGPASRWRRRDHSTAGRAKGPDGRTR